MLVENKSHRSVHPEMQAFVTLWCITSTRYGMEPWVIIPTMCPSSWRSRNDCQLGIRECR